MTTLIKDRITYARFARMRPEEMNPVAEQQGWVEDGLLLPREVLQRNTVLDDFTTLYDGVTPAVAMLADILKVHEPVGTNWYRLTATRYADLLMAIPPLYPDNPIDIGRIIRGALFGAIVNMVRYGGAVLLPVVRYQGDMATVAIHNIDPRLYWRSVNGSQNMLVRRAPGLYRGYETLGDGAYQVYDIRTGEGSNNTTDVYSMGVYEAQAMLLWEQGTVLTQEPADGDMGWSMFTDLYPLATEILARNTLNSFILNKHSSPLLMLKSKIDAMHVESDQGDVDATGLERVNTLKVWYDQQRQADILPLNAEMFDDASYLTWDGHLGDSIRVIRQIEEQIYAITGIPSSWHTASGQIASGSALKRLYVGTYARTSQMQNTIMSKLVELSDNITNLLGVPVPAPVEWVNPLDSLADEDNTEMGGEQEEGGDNTSTSETPLTEEERDEDDD